MPRRLQEEIGRSEGGRPLALVSGKFPAVIIPRSLLQSWKPGLILNADPVFQDKSLAIFDLIDEVETHIARTLSEAVSILLGENFDAFVVQGQLKAQRKELAGQTVFAYHLNRLFRRPATTH